MAGSARAESWRNQNPDDDTFPIAIKQFCNIIENKILELKNKQELTDQEGFFIDRVADLAARNLSYILKNNNLPALSDSAALSITEKFKSALDQIFNKKEEYYRSPDLREKLIQFGRDREQTTEIITTLTRLRPSVRDNDYTLRPLVEDCAIYSLNLFARVEENSNAPLDYFVEVNIKSIMEHFDRLAPTQR